MITVQMNCTRCGGEFPVSLDVWRSLDFKHLPKRCCTCQDELQNRPDVVLDRVTVYEQTVRVHSSFARLFAGAEVFQPLPTDKPSRRLVVKGARYGADWRGRIDISSHVWPISQGDVVSLAFNKVKRRVWYVETSFRTCGFRGFAVSRTTARRVPKDYLPKEGEGPVQMREEENEYVLLTQTLESTTSALQRDALPSLCWVEAYTKHTLKGFGRQFSRVIEGMPIWHLSIDGGARSHRFHTSALLAVIDPLDPLTVVLSEDGHSERVNVP